MPAFSILMFVSIVCDFRNDFSERDAKTTRGRANRIKIYEIYAGDTLLLLTFTKHPNHLPRNVPTSFEYYDTSLNNDECNIVRIRYRNNISFEDGKALDNVDQEQISWRNFA